MAVRLGNYTAFHRRRSSESKRSSSQRKLEAVQALSGSPQRIVNRLSSKVNLQRNTPELFREAMQIGMVREHVENSVPEGMKQFIKREFGTGDMADRMLYGYVRDPETKRHLQSLLNKR